ncbi:Vacuolar import and degradation protein 27 [Coemansia interrupta]|uniref:Vacuolar import and degradation protein 27 n=1 Tax=Coemansia interrupta TaxID=1126814 RepID=A0A9W8HL18_9FUNG|nr:Vacuolar import and degradation protein 27 [Coemansia interrupta]
MYTLRSLGKLVWGSKDNPVDAKLASGTFYEIQPGSKVARKCLYKDSELSIRSTDAEHQYQLVVQQVFDDGEEELEGPEELEDDERAFLIGIELKFAATRVEGFDGFKWLDPADPSGTIGYEFIVEDPNATSKTSQQKFTLAIARCAWERKNGRPFTQAPEADIKAIVTQVEDEELEKILNNVKISDEDILNATAEPETLSKVSAATADESAAPAAKSPKQKHVDPSRFADKLPQPPTKLALGDMTVLVMGSLYLFDGALESFVEVEPKAALSVIETAKYTYHINVISDERNYLTQLVHPSMNAIFNHDYQSMIWNFFENDKAYSFSLVASDEKHYEALHQGMTKAAYETLNREPWSKVSVSSQDYMLDAQEEDVEMMSVPDTWSTDLSDGEDGGEDKDEPVYVSSSDEGDSEVDQSFRRVPLPAGVKTGKPDAEDDDSYDEEDSSDEDEDDDDNDDESEYQDDEGEDQDSDHFQNSILEVGYKHNRTFVVRGHRIGVFRHSNNGGIKFDTTISNFDDTHGKKFTPSSAMLHQQDSSMVLMNQDKPNDLYRMDLEYGKVVDEWKVNEDIPTVSVAPVNKYSQMTGEQTLVGLSHNMLYRIDPRIGGDNLIVQNELQSYATKSHFTSLATTKDGGIVVGSAKGEIRMYDRLGVRSKTTLPALGEPIIGIDVTSDGRYIVATCKAYLLLIDAKLPDDPKGRTGFTKPFPQAKKPAPRRLQLKPEHVVYMGAPIEFTPAKFNQSPDSKASERTIVTSTGPFVITWNLRRALGSGRGDAYHIKQYSDHVVSDNFRFGEDRSIVVALPNDVKSVMRSQLAKPTRKSLMIKSPLLGDGDIVAKAPF